MSAPAAPDAMRPDKLERTLLARLGLDPSATPEDLSTAHQAVSAFLAAAPRSLRAWARVQASGADEAYALLTDPVALSRAVALDGTGTRSDARPGEPATPPARREPKAVGPVAVVPATGDPAAASAISPTPAPAISLAAASATNAATSAPAPVDENGRRIVSDDEIDALLAEVDPTAHREIVGTAAERSASRSYSAEAGGTSRPSRLLGIVSSNAFRNLALVGATVSAIVMVAVFGFNAGGTNAGSIGAGTTPAPNAAASAPALDQAAVAALMVKIQANPNDAEALMSLGNAYYETGDFTTAGGWFSKVTKVEPTNVRGFLALGASAFNLGDQATAETAWNQAVSIDEKNVEAHYDLGFLYLNRQPADMAGVKREWTRVVELDPNSATAKTVKAHLDAFASASAAPASSGASAAPAASLGASPAAPAGSPAASPAPSGSPQP